jgi:regulator of protease activity HflC (stomatin/prohibitin superfamily)
MEIREKVKAFSGRMIILLFIFLFIVIFLFNSIFYTVLPGHGGVLFKRLLPRGTVLDKVYGEGLQVIWPWDTLYIYDARIHEVKQGVDVLSQNGLTIQVNVSIRYHLSYNMLPILHTMVGPDYKEKIIVPVAISSVREAVGKYKPEELYTSARHLIQDEILIEAIEETGRVPIIYDTTIIETIQLPPLINSAIESKLRQQQQHLEYEFRLKKERAEVERKRIEATGIKIFQNTVRQSLSDHLLTWKGIQATLELAKSKNSKIVIVGGGKNGLPIILNTDTGNAGSGENDIADPVSSFQSFDKKDTRNTESNSGGKPAVNLEQSDQKQSAAVREKQDLNAQDFFMTDKQNTER